MAELREALDEREGCRQSRHGRFRQSDAFCQVSTAFCEDASLHRVRHGIGANLRAYCATNRSAHTS
jgi:hypothetical protein